MEDICANGGLHPKPREMLKLQKWGTSPQKTRHAVHRGGHRNGTQIGRNRLRTMGSQESQIYKRSSLPLRRQGESDLGHTGRETDRLWDGPTLGDILDSHTHTLTQHHPTEREREPGNVYQNKNSTFILWPHGSSSRVSLIGLCSSRRQTCTQQQGFNKRKRSIKNYLQ